MNLEILDYINGIEIIDTHEHLPAFEADRERNDVISEFLIHYFSVDLVTSGLSLEQLDRVRASEMPLMEKWNCIEEFWKKSRLTGYGQSVAIAARDIYGIGEISKDSIEELNKRYLETFDQPHYHRIMKEKSKIKVSILDRFGERECDKDYFIMANSVHAMVYPGSYAQIEELEREAGIGIGTLDEYLRACEIRMDNFLKSSRILKCALAYARTLDYVKTPKSAAEKGFESTLKQAKSAREGFKCDMDFSNYMFHHIVNLARQRDMVMQIHTGIQEGNGNILSKSHPCLLNEIFMEYPDMKFDIFHIGYPYQSELGVMCKMFQNVYIDMCWAHIVSPVASRNILSEWLEFLPYNKILGFGGDYCFVDGVYGHQHIARRNIAEVLSEKAERGLFSMREACEIGKAILHDNPAKLFGIRD